MNTTLQATSPLLPPGPASRFFGIPLLRQMRLDYLGQVQRLHAAHGDAVYARIGPERTYDFFRPEWVREILVDKASSFIRWEHATDLFAEVHGQSVLVSEGNEWQRQRRMLQPGFGLKRMPGYAQLMVDAAQEALDTIALHKVQTLDFEALVTQLTMDVVLRTLFSSKVDASEARAVADAVQTIGRMGMEAMFWPFRLPDWLPHKWKIRQAKIKLDTLVRHHIEQRRQQLHAGQAPRNDLLGMLLSVRDEDGDKGALSDKEVRDQCMTLFLAGHETTASALTWWGYTMAAHPAEALRAQAEVDQVLGQRRPTYSDVQSLAYLGRTLKETMRLYPPTPALFSRRAIEPVQIGPWQLPKGALVRITPWVLHHDARWHPDPEHFDPERFSESRQATQVRGSYMPFGAGPRVCIGSLFATTEMVLIAAMVLQRFSLAPVQTAQQPRPVLNVTLRPANGMPLQLLRREASAGDSLLR